MPNYPEYYYLLIGMLCGIDPETNKGMYPQKIEYNGYEFTLQTFKDKTLQMIQLYILNSSLEQAIGRARLGSHDCTVKVFARFPIDQAEIMK